MNISELNFSVCVLLDAVEWSSGCRPFQAIEHHDQQFLLETSLSRILLIDLATSPELSSPYVRYIFENYFTSLEEVNQVSDAIRFIESLELDSEQATQVKLLLLLQSGEGATTGRDKGQSRTSFTERAFLYRPNLVAALYSQVEGQLYGQLKRKNATGGQLALQIGRILVLLSNLKRLRPSHFGPIHGALLRWIRLNANTELAT